ncbi:MAG: hypothetical protein MUF00_13940 [Gemmatimonadaceae bacterium]|jgi:hypothetical protein|nr:hypothetical protein [Gemmatimonadaceae bacterium]
MSRRTLITTAARGSLLGALVVALAACSGGDAAGPSGPRTPPAPTTGALTFEIAGLPTGVPAALRLTGPTGERAITTAGTVSDLAPGEYTIAAAALTAPIGGFAPDSALRTANVRAGSTGIVRVRYDITTGMLTIVPTGLPAGASGRYTIRPISDAGAGPARELGDTTSVGFLTPGRYALRAHPSRSDSGTWVPSQDSVTLSVPASTEPVRVPVSFTALPARLAIDVQGLPANAEASMIVRGPGLARPVVQSLRFDSLARGTYELEAGVVRASGFTWRPDSTRRTITLRAGDSASLGMRYGVSTGALAVAITGIPEGFPATVRVNGPNDFTRVLSATTTLTDIPPGDYDIVADTVRLGSGRYDPAVVSQRVQVTASVIAAPATVQYRAAPGRLLVSILGVPGTGTPVVTLSGASGWSRTLSISSDLVDVPAGTVRVSAASFTATGDIWRASVPTQDVIVPPGGVASASVTYAIASGRLQITASGLPASVTGTVSVTGPAGFARTVDVATSALLTGLEPGAYAVTANSIAGATPLFPTVATQNVTIARNVTSTVQVAWQSQAALNNLVLDGAYITQAIQRFDGTVPLVANRDGLLRVFVRAAQPNGWQPAVRVRLYDGATLVQTSTINAQESGVRTVLDEGTLSASWNLPVPAALLRTGLRVLVDVDPSGALPESNESDNVWPRNGTPQTIDVRNVPALPVRFISVVNAGRTGNVTAANVEQFLVTARRLFPLGTVNASVRATPYTSTTPQLDPNDQNDAWETILGEINALRVAEGPANSYYYGVVRVGYSSGIAGMGYVPGRASIGWDYLPSGDEVAAHELGHNFGRGHAPCGVAGDADFPHAGGRIGVFGFNFANNLVQPPTRPDLMGYCGNPWVSDWTWVNVLNYRAVAGIVTSNGTVKPPPHGAHSVSPERRLLVWGRATARGIVLEPAFALDGASTSASNPRGAFRVDGRDAAGALLFTHRFDADDVDHARNGAAQHFAVSVPLAGDAEQRLVSLTVTRVSDGRVGSQRSAASVDARAAGVETTDLVRRGATSMQVRYEASTTRMALVRDLATGEILSFVRNPSAEIRMTRANVEVLLSDGVKSRPARVRVVQPN